jgi:hypothetical protein
MIRVLLITLCLLSAGTASAETVSSAKDDASAQSLSSRATAAITYLTTSTVYVSAGRKNKLSEGSRLSVIRADSVVGTIEVINLSSDRASCKILESSGPFLVGDQVGWNAEDEGGVPTPLQLAPPESTRLESSRSSTGSTQSWLRENGIRGRISGRYLTVRDRSGTGQNLSQPALDARLEGRQIGGSDWDLSLDVRARRTFREEASGTNSQEGRSRVYRANLSWKPLDSRVSLMMGRQYSPELSSLGIFDGASFVLHFSQWSMGLLSGSQPDPVSFGYSGEIREHGLFVQRYSAQGSKRRLSVTMGAIGSYVHGEINREYLAFQTHYTTGSVSVYLSQDVDYNRGWKREIEGQTLSLNNTYASLRVRAAEQTTLAGGFDNRRNVRLYRDYISPEVEFDDTYRQGVWAGITQRFAKRYRLGVRVKRSTGGTSGNTNTYTLNGSVQWRVNLQGRTSRFDNDLLIGWIHSGSASVQVSPKMRLEIGGGLRTQTGKSVPTGGDRLSWTNALADYSLGRQWYASLSFERSHEGDQANDQIFSMLSYRF